MPDNQSPEKPALLRTLGAEVRVVKTVPYADPNNYQKLAPTVGRGTRRGHLGNQFDNVANRDAHYETTGPEIWRDTRDASTRSPAQRAPAARSPACPVT